MLFAVASVMRQSLGHWGSVDQLISPNSHMETRKSVAADVDDVLSRDSMGVTHLPNHAYLTI
jgi:hypothetical protein